VASTLVRIYPNPSTPVQEQEVKRLLAGVSNNVPVCENSYIREM
jgi:hypothetical protein